LARVSDDTFNFGDTDDFFGGFTDDIEDALDTDALVTEIEEEVVNVQVSQFNGLCRFPMYYDTNLI